VALFIIKGKRMYKVTIISKLLILFLLSLLISSKGLSQYYIFESNENGDELSRFSSKLSLDTTQTDKKDSIILAIRRDDTHKEESTFEFNISKLGDGIGVFNFTDLSGNPIQSFTINGNERKLVQVIISNKLKGLHECIFSMTSDENVTPLELILQKQVSKLDDEFNQGYFKLVPNNKIERVSYPLTYTYKVDTIRSDTSAFILELENSGTKSIELEPDSTYIGLKFDPITLEEGSEGELSFEIIKEELAIGSFSKEVSFKLHDAQIDKVNFILEGFVVECNEWKMFVQYIFYILGVGLFFFLIWLISRIKNKAGKAAIEKFLNNKLEELQGNHIRSDHSNESIDDTIQKNDGTKAVDSSKKSLLKFPKFFSAINGLGKNRVDDKNKRSLRLFGEIIETVKGQQKKKKKESTSDEVKVLNEKIDKVENDLSTANKELHKTKENFNKEIKKVKNRDKKIASLELDKCTLEDSILYPIWMVSFFDLLSEIHSTALDLNNKCKDHPFFKPIITKLLFNDRNNKARHYNKVFTITRAHADLMKTFGLSDKNQIKHIEKDDFFERYILSSSTAGILNQIGKLYAYSITGGQRIDLRLKMKENGIQPNRIDDLFHAINSFFKDEFQKEIVVPKLFEEKYNKGEHKKFKGRLFSEHFQREFEKVAIEHVYDVVGIGYRSLNTNDNKLLVLPKVCVKY